MSFSWLFLCRVTDGFGFHLFISARSAPNFNTQICYFAVKDGAVKNEILDMQKVRGSNQCVISFLTEQFRIRVANALS